LLDWYSRERRDLPWRATRDPYRIWLSEIMLQQTRVAAAIPYYERFLTRFPTVEALARAPEQDVLALWAGLGYYSRARNLHRAAAQVADRGFPHDYESFRALPGVGDYTAAAIASIAFGEPRAAVDGNVVRVIARLAACPSDISSPAVRKRLGEAASTLLDRRRPGDFNQAMIELGATVCLPRDPRCAACPIAQYCQARRQGRQLELPVRRRDARKERIEVTLAVVRRDEKLLLRRRPADAGRMAGFWELPEAGDLPRARIGRAQGEFRHAITYHDYRVAVVEARVRGTPRGYKWVEPSELTRIPLTTATRKAIAVFMMGNRCPATARSFTPNSPRF
jgi:A/G-specific adenine glycosylase